jgi:hypothetical protein
MGHSFIPHGSATPVGDWSRTKEDISLRGLSIACNGVEEIRAGDDGGSVGIQARG